MEYNDDQRSMIATTLKRVVTDDEIKLKWGALKRAEMHKSVREGKIPTDYRYEWMKRSRLRVVDLLSDIAKEFNRTWKHDRMSISDLMDICSGAYYMFDKMQKKTDN